jgi:Cu(I)/Ag(I) efflux system membrane fusion protein
MDHLTPHHLLATPERTGGRTRLAFWALAAVLVPATIVGAGLAGLRAGEAGYSLPSWVPKTLSALLEGDAAAPAAGGPVLYYQDPDSKPAYASEPKKTADGRDYIPVRTGADVSFDDRPNESVSGSTAGGAGSRTVLYYRNPMGLPDTSPVPKKDSMGMDYLPVYDGEHEDGSTVKVSLGKLQRTGVRSEAVERRVVTRAVRAPGTVKLDERRVAVISLRSESFVERVENVTTGDQVRKGQPLLRLYSPEFAAASAQYLSALNDVSAPDAGRSQFLEGVRRRLANLNIPSEVLAEIERTRKVPLSITWSAPRDGIVLERNAIDGMRAMPGDVLFRLADISTVWVLADVPEHELASVRPGQEVSIRVRSLPGRVFSGRVGLIYPQVNPETRTTRVRTELSNPEGVLLPEMYADVEFTTGAGKPVVAVPESALIDTGTRQVVILDKGEGRFEPREVKVGVRGNGYFEIREGIEAGDKVVVAANFLIDAESNLKAALQGMSAAPSAQESPQ